VAVEIASGSISREKIYIKVQGQDLTIRPFQIMLWACLTPTNQFTPPSAAHRFPILVDTGHTHNFSISEKHLRNWARLKVKQFLKYPNPVMVNDASGNNHQMPLYDGCLWLLPNNNSTSPFRVDLDGGFTLFPENLGVLGPRIPLLGGRALSTAKFILTVDYISSRFSLMNNK
jgi:hypothetical protein